MIKKIIFSLYFPFSEQDYNRFGIKLLEKNGFEVEVWDFTCLIINRQFSGIDDKSVSSCQSLRVFQSRDEALAAISGLNKDEVFIVSLIPFSLRSHMIYRVFTVNKLKYAVLLANTMPFTAYCRYRGRDLIKNISFRDVVDKLKASAFKRMMEVLTLKIVSLIKRVEPAYVGLAGGEKSVICNNYPVAKSTRIFWMHSLDYDLYLKEKGKPYNPESGLGVFIDEYLPFHPNYSYFDIRPYVTADNYYPVINKFFANLENRFGAHIRIAAHPRSNYQTKQDYFGARPVLKDKTVELLMMSSFVIAHASTAINLAVLLNKPIIFITTDEIKSSPEGVWIDNLASLLGRRIHNLNKGVDINLDEEIKIDHALYEKYRNDYIKRSGSPEFPFWQIFSDKIKDLLP